MNADALKSLPQFIDGTGDSMWPIEPDTTGETTACRYVKLEDIKALLEKENRGNNFPKEVSNAA